MEEGTNNRQRGYDHATVRDENGSQRSMTRSEYEKLALAERIRLVLQDRVDFYREGTRIPAREALKVSPAG